MDKRILAVLIAALAGGAYAQAGYTTQQEQLAQASTADVYHGPSAARGATARTPAPISAAPQDAYLMGAGTQSVVVNSAGYCVRTGEWSPAKAAEPCDTVARASTPAPVVAAAPEPAPAPAAAAEPQPAPPVIEKITLSTDVLFPFNKAELLPGGKDKLDSLAKDAQGANVERIVLAGYADRIGSEEYNRDLSERRAQAVADYLASKGVDQSRIQVEGRGEDNPVTGDQCKNMGPEKASNKKLVSCLQPDRRVEAELLGSREVAGGAAAPAGATSPGATGSSTGAGESPAGSGDR